MLPKPDGFQLQMLYDVARGFIGLRGSDEILRHCLLSLMGSCGASFAAILEREPAGKFVLRASRGLPQNMYPTIRVSNAVSQGFLRNADILQSSDFSSEFPGLAKLPSHLRFNLVAALRRDDEIVGLVGLGEKVLHEPYTPQEVNLVREICEMAVAARAAGEDGSPREKRSTEHTERSADRLRSQHPALDPIKGDGPATTAMFEEVLALAEFDWPVLIQGETGTGKELVARAIHDLSPRAEEAFEAINCAAIPPELMASALFGHERGAFTGALATARGAFERAGKGTIFLDEIGDMPFGTQAMLLRVLQERSFRRVGGERTLPAQARVVSATNQNLVDRVKEGRFRADLFYRIQMYAIRIPPLRERREEIPLLVDHIIGRQGVKRRPLPRPSPAFLQALARLALPGNVRELEGIVLRALVMARDGSTLRPAHMSQCQLDAPSVEEQRTSTPGDSDTIRSYAETERAYIQSILQITDGNKQQAASLMKIPRTTLNARLKKLGL